MAVEGEGGEVEVVVALGSVHGVALEHHGVLDRQLRVLRASVRRGREGALAG